jgi:flagellar motor switch protein FliM
MSETRGTLNLAIPAVVSNALLRKISADFNYQRPRTSAQARMQLKKKMLDCFFSVELSLCNLKIPLPKLTALAAGDLVPFSVDATSPALLMVENVRLGSAIPVQINEHRAAGVLSVDDPQTQGAEI